MCIICEQRGPKMDFVVPVTLNHKRREALGRAIGLVVRMAKESKVENRPAWQEMADELLPMAEEIRLELSRIDKELNS